MAERIAIIGGSAAGVSALLTLKKRLPQAELVLVSKEPEPFYSRCLLSYFLSGDIPRERLFIWDDLLKNLDFKLKNSVQVLKVDAKNQRLVLSDGSKLGYDYLLVASGSRAKVPEVKGGNKLGVFTFRNLEDSQEMLRLLPEVKGVCILGGGAIGMRLAYAFLKQQKQVYLVVKSPHILVKAADTESARLIEKFLEEKGLKILTGREVVEIVGKEKVQGVVLDEGSKLDVEMVVFAKGVIPNREMLEGEVEIEDGIMVDDKLRSSNPRIYAAGDVAQAKDVVTGKPAINAIWPNAVEQGILVGEILSGEERKYAGSISMNSLNLFGLAFISIGMVKARPGLEEYRYEDNASYRKLVFEGDRLLGVILLSDIREAGVYKLLISRRINLGSCKRFLIENRVDYAKILDLVNENRDKFPEREFQETLRSLAEVKSKKLNLK